MSLTKKHLPALDGVRGIAIAMVVIYHFFQYPAVNAFERIFSIFTWRGNIGVELFFVLSGFLITGILLDGKADQGYFKNFYMRRLLRIFPLYYGVLIAIFLVVRWLPFAQGPAMDSMVANQGWAWGYAVNILVAKTGFWTPPYLFHFWSLAVEEHFYLFWPFLVFFLRREQLVKACWLIIAASTALCIALQAEHADPLIIYSLTPCRLGGLAAGGLLAALLKRGPLPAKLPWVLLGAGVIAKLAIYGLDKFVPATSDMLEPFRNVSWTMLGVALVLGAATAGAASPLHRILTLRGLQFAGKYSYGIYVFHFFISFGALSTGTLGWVVAHLPGHNHTLALFLHNGIGIALAVLIGVASYHGYEKHFLKLKKHFAPHPERPAEAALPSRLQPLLGP